MMQAAFVFAYFMLMVSGALLLLCVVGSMTGAPQPATQRVAGGAMLWLIVSTCLLVALHIAGGSSC